MGRLSNFALKPDKDDQGEALKCGRRSFHERARPKFPLGIQLRPG